MSPSFTVDCEKDEEIHLNISGKTLSASTVQTPIIAISNYVFNGLRQDAFSLSDGAISEAFVSVSTDKECPLSPFLTQRAELLGSGDYLPHASRLDLPSRGVRGVAVP